MQTQAKRERIVEAVRHGLEGDTAVGFVHQSGYAMTAAGIARHLRAMGGRGTIHDLIDQGLTNVEIIQTCFPDADLSELKAAPPTQGELFGVEVVASAALPPPASTDAPLYETTKVSLRVPADLYEAIRLAAKVEKKTQTQLIVEILTSALSQMPGRLSSGEEAG